MQSDEQIREIAERASAAVIEEFDTLKGSEKILRVVVQNALLSDIRELQGKLAAVLQLCDEWDATYAKELALMCDDRPYEVEPGIRHHLSMIGDLRAAIGPHQPAHSAAVTEEMIDAFGIQTNGILKREFVRRGLEAAIAQPEPREESV